MNEAIDRVKQQVAQLGNARFESAAWGISSSRHNTIAVRANTPQSFKGLNDEYSDEENLDVQMKMLTWPVVRDSLLALSNFIAITNSSLRVRDLRFGINHGFRGEVGQGRIG